MQNNPSQSKSDKIKADLKEAFDQLERKALLSRVLFGTSLLILTLILLVTTEQFQFLDSSFKIGFVIVGVIISSLLFFILHSKIASISFDSFYRKFARDQDLNEINYYLDLEKDNVADSALVQAALKKNLSSIDYKNFQEKLATYSDSQYQNQFFNRSLKVLSVLGLFFVITAFSFSDGAKRSAYLWKSFEKPNPYSYSITPGDITFEQGSSFSASIRFDGNDLPKEIQLFVKTEVESEFRSLNMEPSGAGFVSIPFNLNNNLEYFVQMDEFSSETYNAFVQLRPRFSDLNSTIIPPAYTKLDSTFQSYPFSLIRAYQGSKLSLKGLLNKDVSDLVLHSSFNSIDTNYVQSREFFADFSVSRSDTISFVLEDASGLKNKNPFQFIIEPLIDEYPIVELIEPSASFEMVEPKDLTLTFKATDDFNLTRGELKYELKKAYVDGSSSSSIRLNRPINGVLQQFGWDLSELELSPLDELTFWIEATDNDGYNGRKTSRSQEITLTVPSLVDYFESLDKKEGDVEKDLESISESFEEMSKSYEEFEESLKENPETSYENQKQVEQAAKQQEEVQKKIDELNKKFEEIKKELSENNLLSEETQKAYDELKKLMEEIDDPSLREALEKLRENMQDLTPDQLRRAMEEVSFNEEDFKKRLERTIELFKKLKLMSDMEKLAKSFEDQARQEKELAENPPSKEEAENKRKEDLEQLEKLKEAIDKLSDHKSDETEKTVSEYQEEAKEELQKNIEEQIQEWLEQQENNDQGQGDQQQQNDQPNLQEPFQNLAQKTREQMQAMGQQQEQINIAGLQYVLYSLLNLSTEQEDLVYLSQQTEDRSLAYVELARDQRNIDQIFGALSDSLFELSKSIPQFSNQINTKSIELKNRLDRSLTQMAERNQRNSSISSRQAFGGINEIAFMIANLLEQLQNSDSNGGEGRKGSPQSLEQMIEQLGEMKGNQQQLNEQLQQMINDMQGERLSNDQMERLNELAKQQNRIRKQLQELKENGGLEGDRAGSEIERMIEEMENTINDLRGGALDPTLIERQQNILTRMLEAQEAMQERDEEEKEREAKQPGDFNRSNPSDITLEDLEKQIRSRLNDPNFTKYSPDYQRLIERYFELLKNLQQRNS
jgi:methyl-accepting chemotaxis protein